MNKENIKLMNRKNRFFCILAILLALIFIRYVFQVDFPREVLLIVAMGIAIFGGYNEIIALCICCIPLYTSLQYTFIIGLSLILYVIKYGKDIRINLSIIPIGLMLVWELLHCLFGDFSTERFFGLFMPFFFCVIMMCDCRKRYDYPFIVRAFSITISGMCMVLISKLLVISEFNIIRALSNLRRLGTTSAMLEGSIKVTGAELNPNTLGIMCVLALAGLFQLRISGLYEKNDKVWMFSLFFFGALTSSRTYVVCLLIMLFLIFISQKESNIKKIHMLGRMVVLAISVLLLLYVFFRDLLMYYYNRFQVEDITAGRSGLLEVYYKYIIDTPMIKYFGIGLHDFDKKILNSVRVANVVPHNGIQELIIAWGIPGLILFGGFLACIVIYSKRSCYRRTLINFIPLIILIAKVQVGQMVNSAYTMLAFSYAYLSLNYDFWKKNDN